MTSLSLAIQALCKTTFDVNFMKIKMRKFSIGRINYV